jgi:hypothetical protein
MAFFGKTKTAGRTYLEPGYRNPKDPRREDSSPPVGWQAPHPEDREEARRLAIVEELPSRAWVAGEIRDGNNLRAVKICSAVLQDHFWLILDRRLEPKDGLAIYYPEEIPAIAAKSTEELKQIHKVKLKFPGCRVIQDGPESTERE